MTEPTSPTRPHPLNSAFWPLAALVTAWIILIHQVRHHWGGESYYNFGWFVPFLTVWLFLKNIEHVPARPASRVGGYILLSLVFLLPIIPFHAFSEINPFWRLPFWVQASGICAFSLMMIHVLYGWKGIRASLFPLFFLTTMIPWPFRFESLIVQSLTGIVTEFAVEGLQFLGYPARVAGNSILLGELSIGVNEACSGIRSLQALFMVTLFLGSLFGQSVWRRVAAVVILPLIVIVINSARAIFLATQVIVNGQEAYESWHDPAGYIAFGISMILIYICIELFNIGSSGERDSQGFEFSGIARNIASITLPRTATLFPLLPLIVFLSAEAWFRYHEKRVPANTNWTLELPEPSESIRYLDIHSSIADTLGYGYGHRFVGDLGGGRGFEVYFYGYGHEDHLASISSYHHSPSVCMKAIGAQELKRFPDLMIRTETVNLPMQHYLFELPESGRKLHVFWIFYEHRNMGVDPERTVGAHYDVLLKQLMLGRRDYRRQIFLASLYGYEDGSQARDVLEDLLNDWIRLRSD